MAISFDECRAILDQFRRAHPQILMRSEVHGVKVVITEDEPALGVLVTEEPAEESLLPDERLPERFAYAFQDHTAVLPVRFIVQPVARAQVLCHPGDPASGNPANYYGTLGWNIYLNGVLVCLSNWHVFCAQGNGTPI